MQWSQIVIALLGAFGLIGAAATSIIYSKNLKLREEQNSNKRDAYISLIKTLDKSRSGKPVGSGAMNKHAQEVVYFGSTGVLKAFGDYQQFMFSSVHGGQLKITERDDQMLWMKLLGELMFQIRKDLGNLRWRDRIILKKKSERWHDSLRLTITDAESYIPKRYRGRRGRRHNAPSVLTSKGRKIR